MTKTDHSRKASAPAHDKGGNPFSISRSVKPSRAPVTLAPLPDNIDTPPTSENIARVRDELTRARGLLLEHQRKVEDLSQHLVQLQVRAARLGQMTA